MEDFMNIAIVEDLIQDRERVTSCLNRYMEELGLTYHLYTYESAEEFVEALNTLTFHFLFNLLCITRRFLT